MKKSKENSQLWLGQAKHNLESARHNFQDVKFYSDACFMAEQAAQIALKAYLIYRGERYILAHSVQVLAEKCSKFNAKFKNIIEDGKVIDKYYIPTRYPDALAHPAVPYKSYTEKEANEAIGIAKRIIALVEKDVG